MTLTPGVIFLVENFHQERPDNDDDMRAENFRVQAELRKQEAELESAILSLKTNLGIILALLLLLLTAVLLPTDVVAVLFSVLKSLAPALTIFINFKKIRSMSSML